MIKCFRGQAIETCWSEAEAVLASACRRSGGQLTVDSVKRMLLDGRTQLWFEVRNDWRLAAVTAVVEYPAGRSLSVLLLGGHGMRFWLDRLEAALMQFGSANHCINIEACVRPGFLGLNYRPRKGVLRGCEIVSTVVRKPIALTPAKCAVTYDE